MVAGQRSWSPWPPAAAPAKPAVRLQRPRSGRRARGVPPARAPPRRRVLRSASPRWCSVSSVSGPSCAPPSTAPPLLPRPGAAASCAPPSLARLQLPRTDAIVAVDMEGKTWKTIPTPLSRDDCGFIHRARDHLCFINVVADDAFKLAVWTLEDYGTNKWILKHTVSTLRLFGGKRIRFDFDYKVIAIHPEGNMIFFVFGWDNMLMAYVLDRREVRVIRNLGHDCSDRYLPYVPLFSEAPVDRQ